MKYTILDPDGEIYTELNCDTAEQLELNTPPLHTSTDGSPPTPYSYRAGDQWRERPAQPAYFSEWNPKRKRWDDNRNLNRAQRLKWDEFKVLRAAEATAPFVWNGNTFDFDPEGIGRAAASALTAIVRGSVFSEEWTLTDNTDILLSAQDMVNVADAQAASVKRAWAKARTRRRLINAATTVAQVDAVVW